jgi:hypothetical protein
VPLVPNAVDEVHYLKFSNPSGKKRLLVTSNKLTNNFTGLVTSGFKQEVARGPPVGPR